MAKPSRMIFQPEVVSNYLIKGFTDHTGGSVGDIVNMAVQQCYLPRNKELRNEVDFVIQHIARGIDTTKDELRMLLSRCVGLAKNNPISDCTPLEKIMHNFCTYRGQVRRYDYIAIVDDHNDEKLHHLDEILATLDDDYTLGDHEFGERSRQIFKNWDKLCHYPEIYGYLELLISYEYLYWNLSTYQALCLIKSLDDAIIDSPATISDHKFEVNVSTLRKIQGVNHEIFTYLTDNAYVYLADDFEFERRPKEIVEYSSDIISRDRLKYHRDYTEDELQHYYEELVDFKHRGVQLYRQLVIDNPQAFKKYKKLLQQ